MKNEVMARAITGIDDALIVSAYRPASAKRKVITRICACAAACFIFMCGILYFSHSSVPEISVCGEPVLSEPVAILPSDTRIIDADVITIPLIDANVITIPLEIVSDGTLTVETDCGTIEVYSSRTNERICVGRFCKAKGPLTVQWTIKDPDHSQSYEIKINGKETVLILEYEKKTDNWIITKSED